MRQFSDDEEGFIPAQAELKYKNIQKLNNLRSIKQQCSNTFKVHYRFADGFIKKQPELALNTPLAMPIETFNIKPNNAVPKVNNNFKHPYVEYCTGSTYKLAYCRQNKEVAISYEQEYIKNQVFLSNVEDKNSPSNKQIKSFELDDISPLQDDLSFDSKFQNGNLHCTFRKEGTNQYHLFISNDTNTYGYNQWYYFSIRNMRAKTKYTFEIVNYRKMINFYRNEQKISIFSLKKAEKEGIGWYHGGSNISFQSSSLRADPTKKMYSLRFELEIQFQNDLIMIASNLPYSYSRLIKDLEAIRQEAQVSTFARVEIESICTTVCNNEVPEITIKGKERDKGEKSNKRMIIFMARQHPGEVWSSYMMIGIIKSLLKPSEESKYILKHFIIKIYPMVNIDGVVHGNFRCDITGVDLNRRWKDPSKIFHPQIYEIKKKIQNYSKKYKVDICFDLHGHSKNYNIFCYACKHNPYTCRILPYILSRQNKRFYMPSCTFGLTKDKESTARATISRIIKSQNVLTIEISGHGEKEGLAIRQFHPLDMYQFSENLISSLRIFVDRKNPKYQEFESYIHKNITQFFRFDTDNEEESGSDSEPEQDEIEFKIKLNNVIDRCYQAQYRYFMRQNVNSLHLNEIRFDKGISEQETIEENKDQSPDMKSTIENKRYKFHKSEMLNKDKTKNYTIKQKSPKKVKQVLPFKRSNNGQSDNKQKQEHVKYKSINHSQIGRDVQGIASQRKHNNNKSIQKNIMIRDKKRYSKIQKDFDLQGISIHFKDSLNMSTDQHENNKSIEQFVNKYERYIPNTISYKFKGKNEMNGSRLGLLEEGLARDDMNLQLNAMLENKQLLQLEKLKAMIENSTMIAQRQGKIKCYKKDVIVDYRKFKDKQRFKSIIRLDNHQSDMN